MLITILAIVVLILSAVIHEYAHGWMAWRLGDNTAKDEGRLTLNPFKHLDPVGSVLLPALLIVTNASFFIAWAKPVPYNPYNLRDRRFGELKVALAGPATNIILALVFGLIARWLPLTADDKISLVMGYFMKDSGLVAGLTSGSLVGGLAFVSLLVCFINLALAVFNLIPVPPLDGSKILAAILPTAWRERFWQIERYGFIILIGLLMFGAFGFVGTVVLWLFGLVTGL